MRVLLIEDNEGDMVLVRQGCTASSRPVDLAVIQDGVEALDFLFHRAAHPHALTPDLILLDLNLPRKNGFEILAELERDADLKFLPVVVFAGSNNKADVNRCYELGANAYVVKPADATQYITLVQAIIEFWYGCQFRELNNKK